ncbi:NUDIX hydrolase [Rossellomorea marisflavi]|uniref:NUDIX hydrolase n=1 Tax=Rossellomorea marisflavi TaxID=189381 RepID=UPI00345CA440
MTKTWNGSAGVCFNDKGEVLLVRGYNSTKWAIPSGGIEEDETPEACCVREMMEETGNPVKILDQNDRRQRLRRLHSLLPCSGEWQPEAPERPRSVSGRSHLVFV